jgi:hypothetical protein
MVSTKIAEWIAEFVADVVRLNPALLPSPAAAGGPPTPMGAGLTASHGGGLLRSPRPSPRPSLRSMYVQANSCGSGGGGVTPPRQQQQSVSLPVPALAGGVNASMESVDSSGSCGSVRGAAPASGSAGDAASTLSCDAASGSLTVAAAAAGVPLPPADHLHSSRGQNNSSRSPSPAATAAAPAADAADTAAGVVLAAGCGIPRSPGRSSCGSSSRSSSAAGTESPSPRFTVDSTVAASDAANPAADVVGSSSSSQSGGLKFFRQLGSPAGKALPLARR